MFIGENLIILAIMSCFLAKISFYWRLGNLPRFLPVFRMAENPYEFPREFFHNAKFPRLVLLLFTCG
jgi:hypothetical protein